MQCIQIALGVTADLAERVDAFIQSTFGTAGNVIEIIPIEHGVAKITAHVTIAPQERYLLQVWQAPEPELTAIEGASVDRLWPGGGVSAFIETTTFLASRGVRVPRIISASVGDHEVPGMTLVEYIEGTRLADMDKTAICDQTYVEIGHLVGCLHASSAPTPGRATVAARPWFDCLAVVGDVLEQEVALAGRYDPWMRTMQPQILQAAELLRRHATPRDGGYHLIHGDCLQMLIRANQEPVLIDLDGVQYFDLEYEYSIMDLPFLQLLSAPAFMEAYVAHLSPRCDALCMLYYRICRFVSWISYFSEALVKQKRFDVKEPYQRTRQWLIESLEKV